MSAHAAITIISKNYFAFAQTLAQSYKRHHPEHDFIIVLVDKADGLVPVRLECGAEVIEAAAFSLPDFPRMIYRYDVMELNTAVKPFVLDDLFARRGYETLLYIDPDIFVYAPLAAVYEALEQASIVLTPHMRRPFDDEALPSDVSILQSGTYNLGFIGLRRGDSSRKLLDWWKRKLYKDCVVDLPNGLFVDQKWIDLVPGFFADHAILREPGYNVAYWNLHERRVHREGDGWRVDEGPLVFFHFSGYSPNNPAKLSKHQNRHVLDDQPVLRELADGYARALLENGHAQSSRWAYAYGTLPNGAQLPIDLVSRTMQRLVRQGVPVPCPISEPDAFCRFLMSRGLVAERPGNVLLLDVLLGLRPDVAAAFPQARENHQDLGFRTWLGTSGVTEYRLAALLSFEAEPGVDDAVQDTFERLRGDDVAGVREAFGDLWRDAGALDDFLVWLRAEGSVRLGLPPDRADRLRRAIAGAERIVHLYYLRPDLQTIFAQLHQAPVLEAFVDWLRANRHAVGLANEEISLFREFGLASGDLLARMRTIYVDRKEPPARVAEPRSRRSSASSHEECRVNLAGYLTAASGMGESARSMQATLRAAGIASDELNLPNTHSAGAALPAAEHFFGWPRAEADVSLTVANADAIEDVERFVPPTHWARRNIGYWVWETEELPRKFRRSQERFDEIWTPSRYSAEAIARTVTRPVRVVPHTLDFASIDSARPDRRRFGLPEHGTLFGFAFDPRSVLERKNVRGLIRAFESAMRPDDDCYLVLKVNAARGSSYEFDMVCGEVTSDRVLVIDGVLDRIEAMVFMKTLDVYASLHRAEGFGLTCAEAMACGVPVIASGYSGNLQFMHRDNSVLVPTPVIETDRAHGPYPAGTRWGSPDHDAAVQAMRAMLREDERRRYAEAGSRSVRTSLDAAHIATRVKEFLSVHVSVPTY